ncbi:MAG: sensor histidine kinase [Rhodospirillaceae bacterium]|nr:sensor histidine kinase [Rhodospirillaceae bacterium]
MSAMVRGANLKDILTLACLHFESTAPDSLCAILLIDPTRGCLHQGVGPNLPQAYLDALEGLAIGPNVGCCGTAAYTRQISITDDISTSPRWAKFAHLAAEHNLASCWSIPLLDGSREPLGNFAIYHHAPHCPPPNVRLRGDRQALTRIMLNLLSNALKFTPEHGKITVTATVDDRGLGILVRDNGIGIPADQLPNLGKPFVRVTGQSDERKLGTGLGLFISRSLVELHGGRLDITSEAGAGTNVTVSLPAARISAAQAA